MVVEGLAYILRFGFLIKIGPEVIFFDHVHIDMFREWECRLVVGQVSSCVHYVMLVKLSGLVN